METLAALQLASAIIKALELLAPQIRDWTAKGVISVADQAAFLARIDSLRAAASGQATPTGEFTGPEWATEPPEEVTPAPAPLPPA